MSGGFAAERLARLSAAMQGAVARDEVAGVVTLLHRHGATAHCDVIGFADAEARTPLRRDTLFRIASMTKPVTSVAALMLVEEGKLSLTDRVDRFLPELANPRVLHDPAGALDDTVPAERPITVLDLLTHRSGLAYGFSAFGALQAALQPLYEGMYAPTGPDAWLAQLAALPLMFQPGARWHYGLSTDVLGILVGRAAGQSFPDFVQARLFGPLGMTETGFRVLPEKLDRLAVAYAADPETKRRAVEDHPARSHWANPDKFPSGGGGLVSTVDDYLRFARLLLGGGRLEGKRLLARKWVDLMTRNWLTPEQRRVADFGMTPWIGRGFGLGVAVVDDPVPLELLGDYSSAGSFGWGGAYGTDWWGDPREDMVGLMFIQLRNADAVTRIGADFKALVYAALDE